MEENGFVLPHQHHQPEDQDELSYQHLQHHRRLDEINYDDNDFNQRTTGDVPNWELVYTCVVLVGMFVALVSDKFVSTVLRATAETQLAGLLLQMRTSLIEKDYSNRCQASHALPIRILIIACHHQQPRLQGPDSIMLIALTLFMVAEIISIPEALQGFSNPGLLTVLVLFVVAEGISKTGALDWYMGKLLGKNPNVSTPSAQLRLMLPVACLSAFINNTPVVAVMLPIVQGWAQQIRVPTQQLLIPLSFAAILGGTCTLIGTSTNLVVVGLLADRYPDDPEMKIGLFDVGLYGVPVAMAGSEYYGCVN